MQAIKSHLAIAAAFAVLTPLAQADGATYDYPQPVHSVHSRAEVQSAAAAARVAGLIVSGDATYVSPQRTTSGDLTRAQVRAEAIEARRLGLIVSGEMPVREASVAELEQIHQAGLNATRDATRIAGK
jgi:hypothetical protein